MNKSVTPTRRKHTILKQLCEYIPAYLVSRLARECDVTFRTFSPWSHVVSMLYAHLTHAISLNDVCDGLNNHRGPLSLIRGATAPSRNGLSNANKTRSSDMMQKLFWEVLKHLESIRPGFGGQSYKGFPRRFKRSIQIIDSSTMALVANCLYWAKHRRRKAAAKMHMRLDLKSFLPSFAIVDTARHNDAKRARELCADLEDGEIVIFDKAYIDFLHLYDLQVRGVFWVTRAKDNMDARCVKRLIKKPKGNILRDDVVILKNKLSFEKYPMKFRRIVALVEVDNKLVEMTFISNNIEWSPNSICDLYKCRWSIEAFFKQIKQTLQLSAFLGHSYNAIQWQVWSALLTYVLLRFMVFVSQWSHGFRRIFTMLRAVLWDKLDVLSLLKSYGTAKDPPEPGNISKQMYLIGF